MIDVRNIRNISYIKFYLDVELLSELLSYIILRYIIFKNSDTLEANKWSSRQLIFLYSLELSVPVVN